MRRKLEEVRQRVVVLQPASSGRPAHSTSKTTFIDTATGLLETTTTRGAICPSSGQAMLSNEQIGGICVCCKLIVCAECSTKRCAICNQICCDTPLCSTTLRGQKLCTTHRTIDYLLFAVCGRL